MINKDFKGKSKGDLDKITNKFIKDITNNLNKFSYNIAVANRHEIYSNLNKTLNNDYEKEVLLENYKKILICIMPIIPHFSSEALENLLARDIKWPTYNNKILDEEEIQFVIQINGKKRSIIKTERNIREEELVNIVLNEDNLKKYINNKIIKRRIFVPNRLLNIIL